MTVPEPGPFQRGVGVTACVLVDSPVWSQSTTVSSTSSVVPSEATVREALRNRVLARSAPPCQALDEFWVPLTNERADVVVIGSAMAAYEIKTGEDTLSRLPRQAGAYAKLFDTCTVVVAERHREPVLALIPGWWGMIAYESKSRPLTFGRVRPASPNQSVDPDTLVRLLWRAEVRAALKSLGSDPDPRQSRASMWQQLLHLTDVDQLKQIVRTAILGRDARDARLPTRRFSSLGVTP